MIMSYNQLVDKKYQYGSIKRKHSQGYNSYYQMIFGDVYMDLTTENRIIVDRWMQKQLHEEPEAYKAYIQEVDTYMDPMADFHEKTDEAIYSDILMIREHYIHKESLLDNTYKKMQNLFKDKPFPMNVEDLIFYKDTSCERKTAIDESHQYNRLLNDNEAIIIVPESHEQLFHLGSYMKTLLHHVDKIFILLKEKPDLYMASSKHFQLIMDRTLQEMMNQGIIEWLMDTSTCYGFNYDTLDEKSKQAIIPYIEKDSVFVLGFGEHCLLSIKDLNVDSIVMTTIDSWRSRELTLLVDEVFNYAIVYVPRHFNIYAYIPHNEKSRMTYYQLSQISKRRHYNPKAYKDIESLYGEYPEYFFNIYSLEHNKNQRLKRISSPSIVDDRDFMIKRNQALMAHINRKALYVSYHKQYYHLDTLEPTSYCPFPEKNQPCVTVDSIRLDGKAIAEVKKNQGGSIKVSPIRQIAHEQQLHKKRYLLFNFLFFMTAKVSMVYNQLRQQRPYEQISICSGHMDYMYENKEKNIETFPLYHKACIGLTQEGAFKFTNQQLQGGVMTLNGYKITWEKEGVNTEDNLPVKVYTPYWSLDTVYEDYSTYAVEVGHDRLNLVIVNDSIIAVRKGDVILPSIGVVVSLDPLMGNKLIQKIGFEELEEGYYSTERLHYTLKLDREDDTSYQWLYGGGLSIIKDGVNLFKDKTVGEKVLREEGWLSPLSMQTQESNIHELSRHPRTAFGMTKNQAFFGIVFSGRTKENAGVNYIEMAEIAQKEFGPIECMVNVDGGASSLLALIENKELFELNYPGASPTSTAGMARPINSMLIMEI